MKHNFNHNAYKSRSPAVQKLMRLAFAGKITKSQFMDGFLVAPHEPKIKMNGKGKRNLRQAMHEADMLEKKFGFIWSSPSTTEL